MLEDLVGMDDVERGVVVAQGEEVAHLETHIGHTRRLWRTSCAWATTSSRCIEADHLTGGDQSGQVGRDRARTATDVEQGLPGLQMGKEIGGEFSAVRQVWLRRTDSWCPWV